MYAPVAPSQLPPWTMELRRWQAEACRGWAERAPEDDLWIVTPGGGKTLGAARLTHGVLRTGRIQRVIYVVPKTTLKEQTALSFSRSGIQLDYRFKNSDGYLSRDLHGVVATYQQVAANPKVFADLAGGARTLVILDEIHHAGDEATWGNALYEAFGHAQHRLELSGTPFRSDGTPIPFVNYEGDECVAGYTYGYADALQDGVCRKVVFALVEGEATWVSRDGQEMTAGFDQRLNKRHASERLRTHLLHEGFAEVLRSAHGTLMGVRQEGHREAGGLVIAMNVDHAKQIAEMLRTVTGLDPELVVSVDEDAGRRIGRFARSTRPWIVAVHMVSEGIDIPRLRVGVFGSNVRTEMYFRQFVGRFVRTQKGITGSQDAFVYIPADPTLTNFASRIRREINAGLKKYKAPVGEEVFPDAPSPEEQALAAANRDDIISMYQAIGTQTQIQTSLYGNLPTQGEFVYEQWEESPEEQESSETSRNATPVVLADLKRETKARVIALVNRCARDFNVSPRDIHKTLKVRCHGSLTNASMEDLVKRERELNKWLERKRYDGYDSQKKRGRG